MNKIKIEQLLNEMYGGYSIGCYDRKMETLTDNEIITVIDNVRMYDYIDVKLASDKVIEISVMGNEVDFKVYSYNQYRYRYSM